MKRAYVEACSYKFKLLFCETRKCLQNSTQVILLVINLANLFKMVSGMIRGEANPSLYRV